MESPDNAAPFHEQRKYNAHRGAPIAAAFEDCVQLFEQLCASLEAGTPSWTGPHTELADLFSTLRTWGHDTGASSRSLDHRLRKASTLQAQVLELFEALQNELGTGKPMIIPHQGEAAQTPGSIPDNSKYDLENLGQDAADTLDCLLDLVPLLQDPVPEDTFERDASPSEAQKDIEKAEEMFPKASKGLVTRLGQANWKRRQYQQRIRLGKRNYQEAPPKQRTPHEVTEAHASLSSRPRKDSEGDKPLPSRTLNRPTPFDASFSNYRKIFSAMSEISNTGLLSNPESIFSTRTDYFDRRSIGTSVIESDMLRNPVKLTQLAVPKPPIPLDSGQGFVCPYCLHEILVGNDIVSTKDWNDHVFVDLEPYMCTWDTCIRADKTFPSRDMWFQHELDNHRLSRVWFCQSCRIEFDQSPKLEEHFLATHDKNLKPDQLALIVSMCERFSQLALVNPACSLCHDVCSDAIHLKDHVGQHMEQLALTSIYIMVRSGESYLAKVENFLDQQVQVDLETVASTFASPNVELLNDPLDARGNHLARTQEVTRTIRTMPPPPNYGFIGREADLAKLYKELSVPGHTCILSGSGGLGKSATAIQYSYQFEQAYSYIFWVHAETPVGCAESYGRIASTLALDGGESTQDLERLILLGREFLERTEKRWLVVFDNVEDLLDIQQYLPANLLETHGSILITTRRMEGWTLRAPSKYSKIELGVLSLEDSRKLLLSSTNSTIEEVRNHPEYKIAGEIAVYAEQLPLALSHIAGYIQVSGCSLQDFVELWQERRRHASFNTPTKDAVTSIDKALEIVWNIGLREVTIDARELLNILSFLDSDTIQKDLLVGEHSEVSLEILHSSEAFRQYRYKRMTTELSRRRLVAIRERDGEEILSIHRSLQAKILQDLNKDPRQRERVYMQAFLLVRKRFPFPSPIQVPEPEKWPICIKYLRHVLSLQKVFAGKLIHIQPSVDLARLLSDGGIGLWERGMTTEGLDLLSSAEGILTQLQCDEDMLKANIHVIIALLIQNKGIEYLAESNERISKALEIREIFKAVTAEDQYSKNDDILLHNARSDYGCVLLQYNKYQEAEPIFAQCLTRYREWGPDEDIPYEHAKFNHHMAFCKMYRKNFVDSIELAKRGVHFVTLATGHGASCNKWKFDTACVILQSGDLDGALEMHKEVLEARIEHHGRSSFLTLQSYYAVGALYSYLGELTLAE
ncbi:hypothetical protein B0O99DRAFT_705975 [Bisporella sp. PMI_857]|nr:hypothetical protein B0O99DRAFT_705975 [Bisporella sp. PMI_857]